MKLKFLLFFLAAGLALFAGPALHAQYRDDQFKRDAFSQNYADTSQTVKADSSQLFSFKEFFGGLAHRNKASLKTLSIGSTVFIGGNQIYHRQYWKLPLIYGGIGAGVAGGIYFNNQFQSTGDTRFKTYSTLSYVGAGMVWWGSLMDGTICYDRGMHPDPSKSTLYSILLPGLGQIYNGEFWKVPLYLGLMAGSVHFCVDNNVQYQRWKWIHNMATTDEEGVERPPQSGETAKYYRDVYRRYRDYSILAIVLSYVIQVVDANVFAYMQDFEVNDDISFRLEPSLIPTGNHFAAAPPAVGMTFGLKF